MKLVNVFREECVVAGAKFTDKSQALCEIANIAGKCPILKDVTVGQILAALEEREKLGSTGFGKGIAIPHCRLDSISDFVVGMITVPDGVDFEALDGRKVNLIVFIIAPKAEPNKHIKLLSAISQTLLIPGSVNELLAENSPQALRESFLRYTRDEIDIKKQVKRNIFHIFVQNEHIFRDILTALTGIETASQVVFDAENTSAYLAKVPLFAGIWRDEPALFSKIIVAVVDKRLANETLRRIEGVTGDLNGNVGTMVIVQDIFYSAGSLEVGR